MFETNLGLVRLFSVMNELNIYVHTFELRNKSNFGLQSFEPLCPAALYAVCEVHSQQMIENGRVFQSRTSAPPAEPQTTASAWGKQPWERADGKK